MDNDMFMHPEKYKKYHGQIPGVFGGLGFAEGPQPDEVIEKILRKTEEKNEIERRTLKESYGINFSNIKNIFPDEIHWLWYRFPFVSYAGVDPNNDKLKMVQIVDDEFVEGDSFNCIPDDVYYYGITSWYDEYGFEIKREVRKIRENNGKRISDLNMELPPIYTITREKGLIKIVHNNSINDPLPYSEKVYYDICSRELPDYDKEYGDEPVFPVAETIEVYEDHKGQVLTVPNTMKQKAILACEFKYRSDEALKTDLSDENIIAECNGLIKPLRGINDSKLQAYLDKKLEELKLAVVIQKETIPMKEETRRIANKQLDTEIENKTLKKEISKNLEFIRNVKRTMIGKVFFNDKKKEKDELDYYK